MKIVERLQVVRITHDAGRINGDGLVQLQRIARAPEVAVGQE